VEEIIPHQVILIIIVLSPQFNPGAIYVHCGRVGVNTWCHKKASLPTHLAETPGRQFNTTSRVKSDRTKLVFSCMFSPMNLELQLLTLLARRQFYCWLLLLSTQKHYIY